MKLLEADPAKTSEIFSRLPADKPITMVNFLKFKAETTYAADSGFEACDGKTAYYERYLKPALVNIEKHGGRVVYNGDIFASIIGTDDGYWDNVLLVEYPSIEAMMTIMGDPGYPAIKVHRTASLDDTRLTATVESAI